MKENKNTFRLCGIVSYAVAALWTVSAMLNFFYNNKIALGAVNLCAAIAFVYLGIVSFSRYRNVKQACENQNAEVQRQEQQTSQEQNTDSKDLEN